MNTDISLLILAAGKGSRYGGTKQFDHVGYSDEYLLEYSIYDAIEIGFNRVVVVTSKEARYELEKYLRSKIPNTIYLKCVAQDVSQTPHNVSVVRTKPWGTAHAVWSARGEFVDPFVIVNADDYYGKQALQMAFNAANAIGQSKSYCLVAYPLKSTLSENGTVSRGVCEVDENRLISINEFTQLSNNQGLIIDRLTNKIFSGEELVSMNLWVLTPLVFQAIENQFLDFIEQTDNLEKEELYLPTIIQNQIVNEKIVVEVKTSSSTWMGMTFALDRENVVKRLEELVESGHYPSNLWEKQ